MHAILQKTKPSVQDYLTVFVGYPLSSIILDIGFFFAGIG
jgi:hypothetical protein